MSRKANGTNQAGAATGGNRYTRKYNKPVKNYGDLAALNRRYKSETPAGGAARESVTN